MEKELRRSKSTLQILGTGVIGFALWDLVKTLLIALMVAPDDESAGLAELQRLAEEPSDEVLIVVLVIIALLFVFMGLSLALRIRIGRAARAEGQGRPHRSYVGLAFVFFAFQILFFVLALLSVFFVESDSQTPLQTAATMILELFSLVTMGEVGFTALKVRRLSRETEKAG